MSSSLFISFYSNGHVYVSPETEWRPGATAVNASSEPKVTEAGTLVKVFRVNSTCTSQLLTTLTGSGNSSASALAASGGSAVFDINASGLKEIT